MSKKPGTAYTFQGCVDGVDIARERKNAKMVIFFRKKYP